MSIIIWIAEIITQSHSDNVIHTRQKQVRKSKANKTVNFMVEWWTVGTVRHSQSKETSILRLHHKETR